MRRFLVILAVVGGLLAAAPTHAAPPPWANAGSKKTTTSSSTVTTTTTTVAPTTTLADTTTTIVGETTTTVPDAGLRWPPPADYQTYPVFHVGGTANVVNAGTGDAWVVCDSPLTKGLRINGGRNVVVRGCEINITDTSLADTEKNAVLAANGADPVGGVLHFEGIWGHGSALDDGITGDAPNSHWVIQRTLLSEMYGTDSGNHSDCIQPWWGFRSLRMDSFTCYNQYQGIMFKAEDPKLQPGSGEWLDTTLGRVNLKHTLPLPAGPGWLLNFVAGTRKDGRPFFTGPIHFGSELSIAPRSNLLDRDMGIANGTLGQWFTIAGDTSGSGSDGTATPVQPNPDGVTMDGVVSEGTVDYEPAGGCPGCPGMAYGG